MGIFQDHYWLLRNAKNCVQRENVTLQELKLPIFTNNNKLFNRPGVAGAVLHTASLLIINGINGINGNGINGINGNGNIIKGN